MKGQILKGGAVVLGAILFSTLGIFASDRLQGIQSGAVGIGGLRSGVCDAGSVPATVGEKTICVDQYEASPSGKCPFVQPTSLIQSEQNINTKECYAASVSGAMPWNFISLPQAQRMCAGAGKRLLTNKEWYHVTMGTSPESCVIAGDTAQQTGREACVSSVGIYDGVGNVWEWVNENVVGNSFGGRSLPDEGYVTSVDAEGIAVTSAETADGLYGKDYFWSKQDGVFGMIRGGFYGSKEDAGLYTTNASVLTSFGSVGVGFRCVKDIL